MILRENILEVKYVPKVGDKQGWYLRAVALLATALVFEVVLLCIK